MPPFLKHFPYTETFPTHGQSLPIMENKPSSNHPRLNKRKGNKIQERRGVA
jgi:hypothetical protein